jgi:hypothetical protein
MQLTWFTEPNAPLKFWGAISAMYTGTYKQQTSNIPCIIITQTQTEKPNKHWEITV